MRSFEVNLYIQVDAGSKAAAEDKVRGLISAGIMSVRDALGTEFHYEIESSDEVDPIS